MFAGAIFLGFNVAPTEEMLNVALKMNVDADEGVIGLKQGDLSDFIEVAIAPYLGPRTKC